MSVSNFVEGTKIQERLIDLSIAIEGGVGEGETHIDFRYRRIPYLLENFISSPVYGGGDSLGHNWWFDRLSMFGVLGVIPWILIIWHQIKKIWF